MWVPTFGQKKAVLELFWYTKDIRKVKRSNFNGRFELESIYLVRRKCRRVIVIRSNFF